MSMTYLTSEAMLAISHDMLNDQGKRDLLGRDPMTASLIDRLQDIHRDLSVMTREDGELQARLQEISEQLRTTDQIHDRLSRGIYRALESAADLAATPDESRPFIETRDLLFPEGLSINLLTYREESGNVIKVAERATPQVRATLAQVVIQNRTLDAYFDAWIESGAHLGRLVAERASLSGDEDSTRVSAGDLREARGRWIRIMNMLLTSIELIEIPDPDRRRLLANLREAEAAATRSRAAEQQRRLRQDDEAPPAEPSAEEPTEEPATSDEPPAEWDVTPEVEAEAEDLV